MSAEYEIMPYAYADGYDKIDETNVTDEDIPIQLPKREGPLPTPGYDHLLSQPSVPTVYRHIDNYEQPVDREDVIFNPGIMSEPKQYSDVDRSFADEHSTTVKENVPAYIQLIGEAEDEYSPRALPTVSAELKEINRSSIMSSDSVNEIPSSYLEINEDDTGGHKEGGFNSDEIPFSYLKISEDVTNDDCPEEIPHT